VGVTHLSDPRLRHHIFNAVFPALLVSDLYRLYERTVEARHVHDPMVWTDAALD
jgi:hypothetical protein